MSAMSNYLEQAILDATLRETSYTSPSESDLHLALFTDDPTDENDTSKEVDESWYSRKATGSWSSTYEDGDYTATENDDDITFDAVDDSDDDHTITITHIGIYDDENGGNLLYHEALDMEKTLEVGDVISFAAGSIKVRLD